MKHMTKLALAALAAGSLTLTLQAQDDARPQRPGGGPGFGGPRAGMASPLMTALDTTKDGVLDATEIANASAALKTLDKNSDGQITPEDLRPARPDGAPEGEGQRPGRGERPGQREGDGPRGGDRPGMAGGPGPRGGAHPIMAALDANKDGVLDAAEIANAPAALRSLDKNTDGSITPEELRPGGPGGPRGPRAQ